MTKREATSFVIRLIGIYILLRFISFFPMVLNPLVSIRSISTDLFPAIVSAVVTLAHPIFCLFVIIKSDTVAAWLIREDKPLGLGSNIGKDDIMAISFSIVGLLLIVSVLPKFAEMAAKYSSSKSLPDYQAPKYLLHLKGLFAASAVELILGLCLFFGSDKLVDFWKRKQFQSNRQ